MPKYSRTTKYEGLRNSLQNDSETEIRSQDLSQYQDRLNKISSVHFDAPEAHEPEQVEPIHARVSTPYPAQEPVKMPANETAAPSYSKEFFQNGANYTQAFDNEYIDEYIREVKAYNVNQGNAQSANTDLDILQSLRKDARPAVSKPYPDDVIEVPSKEVQPAVKPATLNIPKKPVIDENKPVAKPKPAVKEPDTADISFFRGSSNRPSPVSSSATSLSHGSSLDFLDDDEPQDEEEQASISDTRPMTKEDIAAEVQRLIKGAQQNRSGSKASRRKASFETDENEYIDDRSTRQQLLNETTQMRAQLDDYEDNLNDVNDKMKHTNQILNIVLIVLIVALTLVLGVVVYWVLLSKGIIS